MSNKSKQNVRSNKKWLHVHDLKVWTLFGPKLMTDLLKLTNSLTPRSDQHETFSYNIHKPTQSIKKRKWIF